MFPKVIKAAAGPHDFGSGNNSNEALPELPVQLGSDPDPNADDSGDPTADDSNSSTSDDPELELYHNASSVCWFSLPLPVLTSV